MGGESLLTEGHYANSLWHIDASELPGFLCRRSSGIRNKRQVVSAEHSSFLRQSKSKHECYKVKSQKKDLALPLPFPSPRPLLPSPHFITIAPSFPLLLFLQQAKRDSDLRKILLWYQSVCVNSGCPGKVNNPEIMANGAGRSESGCLPCGWWTRGRQTFSSPGTASGTMEHTRQIDGKSSRMKRCLVDKCSKCRSVND